MAQAEPDRVAARVMDKPKRSTVSWHVAGVGIYNELTRGLYRLTVYKQDMSALMSVKFLAFSNGYDVRGTCKPA